MQGVHKSLNNLETEEQRWETQTPPPNFLQSFQDQDKVVTERGDT